MKIDPNKTSSFLIMILIVLLVAIFKVPQTRARVDVDSNVTRYVNPFIGTANGGNTFPGAVRPWGMVSVSPHTAPGAPSGYIHGEKYCYGFGMVHLSGTGCADLGSIIVTVSRGDIRTDPESYKCTYANETAAPGFYSVVLNEPAVQVRVTASNRCGMLQFIPLVDGEINMLIDVGRNLSRIGGGAVTIRSDTEIEGYNIAGGFCGEANRHNVYFVGQTSTPAMDYGVWQGEEHLQKEKAEAEESAIGSWLHFNVSKNQPLLLRVGISYVSIANARLNLKSEMPDWNFDRVKAESQQAWKHELAKIHIQGGKQEDYVKFYTALYHTLIHPNIISDVNGEYPLMGHAGVDRDKDRDRYSVFSLWDTYRTLHPLLTLVYPERQSAMIKTMLDIYAESGYLPKWELISNETYMMVGDPATPVIADSYIKGIKDFDIETAYQAMRKSVFLREGETAPPIRAGYHEYLKYHYIPFEQDTTTAWWVWGPVSTTLEYCYADWTLAQVAQKLGKMSDAKELIRRSGYYKNLFDPETQFIRPRLKNGDWLAPFNPLETEGSGSWAGSGGPGYVEGNAWNYTWFVPHDLNGLITLFGGQEKFVKKLCQSIENGQFIMNNEPDIAYPYLFTYLPGEEYRTQQIVTEIINTEFKDSEDGLPGNDDCGTISAWFVFSALGIYPACPASPEYQLGIPLFEKTVIQLDNRYYSGNQFVIEAQGRQSGNETTKKIFFNGEKITDFQILHQQIVAGGKLVFEF